MIPIQLTLNNFLSYAEASLDFKGLHTACICGANGAGKSSLLEAITWAIWGQSRASSDEDVIHASATDGRVDFTFESNQQVYRVIRSKSRGKSAGLDFQVQSGEQFRSLSGKGLRATQEVIDQTLRLDYDTFVNSSYLRQGRADEFMLRRPSERKQILADLLKLDQYETLASQAKDEAKQLKGQVTQLAQSLEPIEEELSEQKEIKKEQKEVDEAIEKLQLQQDRDRASLQDFRTRDAQRQTWSEQISWNQNQYRNLTQDCDRLAKDVAKAKADLKQLDTLLSQEEEINTEFNQLVRLQQEQESLATKFQGDQEARQQRQELENQLNQEINQLNLQIRQTQTRLENIQQQEAELQKTIQQADEVESAIEKLRNAQQRLDTLDNLQLQVSPLLQRRQALQGEIGQVQARLNAKLEQLQQDHTQLSQRVAEVPELRQNILTVDARVRELDKKKIRQQCVHDQGLEHNEAQARLKANQDNYQKQIKELQNKLEILQAENSVCPLCDRGLDEHHRTHVITKTQAKQEEIEQSFWVLQEQMSECKRKLQELRTEYATISQELENYDNLLQQRGQLEATLENRVASYERLQEIETEKEQIELSLNAGHYALDLHEELQQLETRLQGLEYDEQTHALARGEVKRWGWAEVKQARIKDAIKQQDRLQTQKPQLQQQIEELNTAITALQQDSPLQQQIQQVEETLKDLGYDRQRHNQIITDIRNAQSAQLRYTQLQQAKEQYLQVKTRLQELEESLQERLTSRDERKNQIDELTAQIENITDYSSQINALDEQIQQRRRQLDDQLGRRGQLQQRLKQLEALQSHYADSREELKQLQKQQRVYTELGQAFGKNGIQALMIENMLPQLEAQTNQILARLTNNQLHVQFLTQKASKSSSKKKQKLIDTLEIVIADAQGTRAYETYSGGEAFRINFAIRLALAQLLAQRAGTSLQMLIIDEGFGTQDMQGCDRLIAAINAIAPDFSCILTVTHMPQFKEAFQTRIEVSKTPNGSTLQLMT
jgi:exonuclease SbcC